MRTRLFAFLAPLAALCCRAEAPSVKVSIEPEGLVFSVESTGIVLASVSEDLLGWSPLYDRMGEPASGRGEYRPSRLADERGLFFRVFPVDPLTLAGAWEGTEEVFQVGDCGEDDGSFKRLIEAQIRVGADFQFALDVGPAGEALAPDYLAARFRFDGTIEGSRTEAFACEGGAEEKTQRYVGELSVSEGELAIALVAFEERCPEQECVFDRVIHLRRRGLDTVLSPSR